MGSPGERTDLTRRLSRVAVGLLVIATTLVMGDGNAAAIRFPETLADQRPVQAGPVIPGFPIDYLGVIWETPGSGNPGARSSVEPHGTVRFLSNGVWGPWIPLVPDDANGPGQWGSSLVAGGDAEGYQVRGLPMGVIAPRAAAINTTDGPSVITGRRRAGVSALSNCVSRAEWGADESLRYVDYWPETFEPVQAMTVHHTVTANDDPDPAATVRAIYHYHAVDRLWGDIAYQFLIDEAGLVYEGRWSGTKSEPCSTDGDGSDFGHNSEGLLVTGGHAAYYNQGNLGIALLGDFTSVGPKPAARSALETALAEFATRHGLDPLGMVSYYNAVWDTSAYIEAIAAHRDWPSPAGDTACPGDTFYPSLPGVRVNTADLMGRPVPSVSVHQVEYSTSRRGRDLTIAIGLHPAAPGALVSATVTGPAGLDTAVPTDSSGTAVIVIRNHDPGCYTTEVTRVDAPGLLWDGVTPDNGWGCDEDPTTSTTTTTSPTTTTTSPTTTTTSTTVAQQDLRIDGIEPATVTSGGTLLDATITGSGFSADATVTVSGGSGPPPVAVVSMVSPGGTAITLDIVTTDGGPKKDRYWDVTVTNPDGGSVTLADGLIVTA